MSEKEQSLRVLRGQLIALRGANSRSTQLQVVRGRWSYSRRTVRNQSSRNFLSSKAYLRVKHSRSPSG